MQKKNVVKKHISLNRPCGNESTEIRITQNKGKERENSYQKCRDHQRKGTLKLIEIFWWSQTSFSIRREWIYVNTQQRWYHREFLKGATRGLQEEWMEGNLKENYLRLIPEWIDRRVQDGGSCNYYWGISYEVLCTFQ